MPVKTNVQTDKEVSSDHGHLNEFYQQEMKNIQAKMEQRFNYFSLSELVMLKEKVNSY
ncbi:hypothetical protein AWH56_021675 [Anaerobacillus isosaccharinicus]|uniref:Uncharacterized protein n=1 Tax=Anaerobacillus isosaccharinicus TaxID=1532552 RepID=A0A7S7L6B8_9BACI|nr:hypothetical protein [Anaerobacillus isosaccharinicus]MBA5586487.1 hypothetical protein [Anaerobacillus isosaccharinicus]QOY35273.1 hypothetical protein AWH56_021675 [Anaerobacillus isosaccharinicus]